MENMLAGKTVLVTGGTGSIGSGIVKEALEQGAIRVIALSRDEIKHFMMKKRFADTRLETIVGDVRDIRSLEQAFRFDIDIIYHAAAMKHVVMCEEFPLESVSTNILGAQNVVDLALKYNVPKMITISTDKATFPTNVMGATKFIGERITLNANLLAKEGQVFSCVRFGNVANSRGSVIPVFIDNLLNGNSLTVTNQEVTRFIMRIKDAVKLIMNATAYASGGEIFIFKMKAVKLGDLVDVLVNRVVPQLNIKPGDVNILSTSLETGEKIHEDLITNVELDKVYTVDDMYVVLPDNESASRHPSMTKIDLPGYTSRDVELITADEIERLIMEHVAERRAAGGI